MNKREINNLMQVVQNGDENAFANLFEGFKRGVFSFVYSYVKNYYTAEDLVQEIFIKVKLKANLYKQGTNASAWILQIAKNTALDYLKKENKSQVVELDENIKGNDNDNDNESSLVLHDVLNKHLQDEERQIVLLHLMYGYKNKEIAEILNLPIGTVLWKYNTALKKLKEKLKEVGYER